MRAELKLVPPRPGRTPFFYARGTYLGQYVERSLQTSDRKTAVKALAQIRREIENGRFNPVSGALTFEAAAVDYMRAGGERRFIQPLLDHFGTGLVSSIDQAAIDEAASRIYPQASAATRNRQVYTPVAAILRRAKISLQLQRPKGGNGTRRTVWLSKEDALALVDAAWGVNARFAALLTFLLYTGCRLSEALDLEATDLRLGEAYAEIPNTKNGEPRGVFLPPVVVAAIRRALLEPANSTYRRPAEPRGAGCSASRSPDTSTSCWR